MVESESIVKFLVISFIIIFVIYFFILHTKKWNEENKNLKWIPIINNCPDYWVDKGDGVCENIHNLGKFSSSENKRFTDFKEISKEGIYLTDDVVQLRNQLNSKEMLKQKCSWTKRHNISWEGINNLCDA